MMNQQRGWLFIVIAGLCEVAWALALKKSDGFADITYTVVFVVFLAISMVLLSKAMSEGLPMGTAYAVWVGIGAIGTVLLGIVLFDDPVSALRIIFVALIVAGIVGLQVTCPKPECQE